MDGNVQLREDWPAHLDFHFTGLDVDSFLESYLRGEVTGHSAVAGRLVLDGPLRHPEQLQIAGNISDFSAEVEKVSVHNDGPIRFSLSNRALKIDALHLVGDNTDFSAAGSMQLADGRARLPRPGQAGSETDSNVRPRYHQFRNSSAEKPPRPALWTRRW